MTTTDRWEAFEAIVATTHELDAYDGVRLDRGALQKMISSFNAGGVPMHGHHDRTLPVRTRDMTASERSLPDGEWALVVQGLVHSQDMKRIGAFRSMSYTAGEDLNSALWSQPAEPNIQLAADAAWFAEGDIAAASAEIAPLGRVKAQNLYQFSFFPEPKIIIDCSIALMQSIAPSVAASGLWAGIARLWRGRRTPNGAQSSTPTTIEWHLHDGDRRVDAVVRTTSEAVALQALQQLPSSPFLTSAETGPDRTVIAWSNDKGVWRVPQ